MSPEMIKVNSVLALTVTCNILFDFILSWERPNTNFTSLFYIVGTGKFNGPRSDIGWTRSTWKI
jgi:hypothetical protein